MKLLWSVLLAGFLGILVFFGPIGLYILCAIVVGVIFRSFVLLNDIHKQVVSEGGRDEVQEAYEKYLKEKAAN
ncbi:ATP-dependent Lon protease [Sutcliffiella deserti]|uniref:ATP-dependent Lon protease n=1 Tax=Sutcliffiella deserti TaxID=2875501 RepID=UPI001CBF6741|nr:ATP-dependent Lon protease [Sutcliffiella deserti]